MSFILDLLKKAEEEKKIEEKPKIPFKAVKEKRGKRYILLSSLVLILLAVLFFLFKPERQGNINRVETKKAEIVVPETQKKEGEKPKEEPKKEEPKKEEEKGKVERKEEIKKRPVRIVKKEGSKERKIEPKEKRPSLEKKDIAEKEVKEVFSLSKIDMEKIAELFNQAVSKTEKGERREAERLYLEILKIKPDHIGSLNNLGFLYLEEGDRERALSFFRKILEFKKDYPQAYNNIGILLLSEGDKGRAEEYFKKAIELGGGIEAYINLSNLLRSEKRFDEAESLLQGIISRNKNNPELLLSLALLKDEKGETKEAIKYYRALLREGSQRIDRRKILERLKYLESISGNP